GAYSRIPREGKRLFPTASALRQKLAHTRHDRARIKRDAAHHARLREAAGAVFEIETRKPEASRRRRNLLRHRLRRADIERAQLDLTVEFGARHRPPAAL